MVSAPTSIQLRPLAYGLKGDNIIRKNFKLATKLVGRDWLALFLKRNPTITLRKLECVVQIESLHLMKVH
jgi:hypothetical protein